MYQSGVRTGIIVYLTREYLQSHAEVNIGKTTHVGDLGERLKGPYPLGDS